jgi:uncharacterized protein
MTRTAANSVNAQHRSRPRRNLASGKPEPRGMLVRFVVGPDRSVVPDIAHRLPGRGLWLSPKRDVLKMAAASRGRVFARAAGGPVAVPQELDRLVERLLVERVVSLIGLARRGGAAVAGFERVRESLAAMKPSGDAHAVLFIASDASAADRGRLVSPAVKVTVSEIMTANELGAAFGRDTTVFATVAPGTLAHELEVEAGRLALLRAEDAASRGFDALGSDDGVKDALAR